MTDVDRVVDGKTDEEFCYRQRKRKVIDKEKHKEYIS